MRVFLDFKASGVDMINYLMFRMPCYRHGNMIYSDTFSRPDIDRANVNRH